MVAGSTRGQEMSVLGAPLAPFFEIAGELLLEEFDGEALVDVSRGLERIPSTWGT